MDTDAFLLDEFVAEANEHLESIEDDFLALERHGDAPDQELVDKVFRAIHSVKGGAAFVGLARIKELAHAMESLLSKVRAGEMVPTSQHIDVLLQGVDLLTTMVAAPLESDKTDIAAIHAALTAFVSGQAPELIPTPQPRARARQEAPPKQEAAREAEPRPAPLPQSHAQTPPSAPHVVEPRPEIGSGPEYGPASGTEPPPATSPTPAVPAMLAELPADSALALDAETLSRLSAEQPHLYHLRVELDGREAPSLESFWDSLRDAGELLDATFVLPEHDFSQGLPPRGFVAETLLASAHAPDALRENLALPAAACTLLARLETAEPETLADNATPRKDLPDTLPSLAKPRRHSEAVPAPNGASPNGVSGDLEPGKEAQTEAGPPAPENGQAPAHPPTSSANGSPASHATEGAASRIADRGGTVRINVELLDKLMTLAGELVLVRNQQLLNMERSDSLARDMVQRLDMVTSELQETIMQTRMQPMSIIFNKLPRIVRDLSNTLGKQIELHIQGNEVELDKTILEALNDPLVHIIRNSCDHGIEPPEVREQSGKPPVGAISLRAYHEGGQINIQVVDDGQGIDPVVVRSKALERRLRTESELAQMNDRDVLSLIMLPGFSTAEQVSEVSGRGVGMDVVRHAIENLGGNVELESWPNEGTTLHLRLPLTLAIIPCIIATVEGHRFAIPQVNLEELVCLYDDDIFTRIEVAGNQEVYRLRKKLLPMVRLNEILARATPFSREIRAAIAEKYHLRGQLELAALPAPETDSETAREVSPALHPAGTPEPLGIAESSPLTLLQEPAQEGAPPESLSFAVVKVGAERFGLIVDKVLGTEEIVVKPMHPTLKSLRCYSGATVMGDGSVALILDIEGIARHAGVFLEQPGDEVFSKKGMGVSDEDTQSILLFRNGPKEQFALALPLIRRIEKISKCQLETVGNKEFITIDGQSTLVLRLDKLLTVSASDDKDEMFLILPKHIKRPFGILMSHILDIEETAIKLNTESYVEEGILGTDIIRGHLTLFPDIYRLIELAEPSWFSERRQAFPPPQDLRRVLIVEDSSFLRHMLRRYLEADGYEVQDTEHGQHALDVLEEHDFDLVVSDIEMPVMDGLEFIKNLRHSERHKQLPALALTSLDTEEDKRRALVAGFDKYQVKLDRERFLADCTKLLTQGRS